MLRDNVQQGRFVAIWINGNLVAGAQSVRLQQSMATVEITNQIKPEWEEYLPGPKNWRIDCGGFYIKDSNALDEIKRCFMLSEPVEVEMDGRKGTALIVDFPLETDYDDQYQYRIQLLGTGALE